MHSGLLHDVASVDDAVMAVSVDQTVATLRARARAQRAAQEACAQAVRDRLMQRLRLELSPGAKAWLIGSLAWGGFGEHSDVDLVVAGTDSAAANRLEMVLTRDLAVPVEVLRTEELPASFRERIERDGIACHGS